MTEKTNSKKTVKTWEVVVVHEETIFTPHYYTVEADKYEEAEKNALDKFFEFHDECECTSIKSCDLVSEKEITLYPEKCKKTLEMDFSQND